MRSTTVNANRLCSIKDMGGVQWSSNVNRVIFATALWVGLVDVAAYAQARQRELERLQGEAI